MWKSRRDGTTSTLARPRRGQTTVTAGLDLRIATTPSLARPRRGQTTVTAGLDLRIATTSHTCTTPTGSHDGEKANPSMCDLSEVGSILGARPTAGQDLRLCKCDLSEVTGERNRGPAALHALQEQLCGASLGKACRRGRSPCPGRPSPPCRGGAGGGASPLPAGEGPGVGLPFHGAPAASHLISI